MDITKIKPGDRVSCDSVGEQGIVTSVKNDHVGVLFCGKYEMFFTPEELRKCRTRNDSTNVKQEQGGVLNEHEEMR